MSSWLIPIVASLRPIWSRGVTGCAFTSRDGQPPEGFVEVAPTLEDAYLVAIKTGRLGRAETGCGSVARRKAVASNGTDFRQAIAERGDR